MFSEKKIKKISGSTSPAPQKSYQLYKWFSRPSWGLFESRSRKTRVASCYTLFSQDWSTVSACGVSHAQELWFCNHLLESRLQIYIWVGGLCLGFPGPRPPAQVPPQGYGRTQSYEPDLLPSPLWPWMRDAVATCCREGKNWAEQVLEGAETPANAMGPKRGVTTRNMTETFTTLLPVKNVLQFTRLNPLCMFLLPPLTPKGSCRRKRWPRTGYWQLWQLLCLTPLLNFFFLHHHLEKHP